MRRRAVVLAGSLAVHLLLITLAFNSAAGRLVTTAGAGGGPTGPVFTVTVVRSSQLRSEEPDAGGNIPALLTRFHIAGAGEPMPTASSHPASEVESLLRRVEAQTKSPSPVEPSRPEPIANFQGSYAPSPAPLSKSQRIVDDGHRNAQGEASGGASSGRLWGAVEPCWRNLGARGRVPVVLEVALDGSGSLAVPPKVVRDPNALITDARLQAEASAIAAVAACAPRGNLAFSGKTYRLEFPAAP